MCKQRYLHFMNKVGGCSFVLFALACGAGGGSEDEPPCTFEGSYRVAYTLVSGDGSCAMSVAPRVSLVDSDEQQCTTACSFADGPCDTTFVCEPGNPVLECAGVTPLRLSNGVGAGSPFGVTPMFCEYSLTLLSIED